MRQILLVLIVSMFICSAFYSSAQGPIVMKYGDMVEGEITDARYEVFHSFEATTGDIVRIRMESLDEGLGGLRDIEIILLDDANGVIATTGSWSYKDADIWYSFSESGQYQVIASRKDGRSGDDTGSFALSLSKIPQVAKGVVFEGALESDIAQYFAIRPTSDFSLTFESLDGEWPLEIDVYQISSNWHSLNHLAGWDRLARKVEIDFDAPSPGRPLLIEVDVDSICIGGCEDVYRGYSFRWQVLAKENKSG